MAEFLTGVKEKYPAELLKNRIEIEGNVISCFFKDMLLLDETTLEREDFLSQDGLFYFALMKQLRNKGFYSLDEVTILSNLSEEVIEKYEERGGWDTIQHQIDIINEKNFDTYIDILYRENIFIKMYNDHFGLIEPIMIDGKTVSPLTLLRKMTAEEVIEWYEARMTSYGSGYSSKIIEEEEIMITDEFLESCAEGLEDGIPFDIAGADINGEVINCYPFLSRQISGLLPKTLTMIGGYSSVGKSTWIIAVLMGLIYRGSKILIISNEESVKKYKVKFLIWLLAKHFRYYAISKKKLTAGALTEQDREMLKKVQALWNTEYLGKVKFISISEADTKLVKKKIRENVLRYGYDVFFYDTFKLDYNTAGDSRTDLALVQDSRDLDSIAKKYNVIGLAALQLTINTTGKLFLDASVLSNSKQIKEVLEGLFLMRNAYAEELDSSNKKYFCRPFRLVKHGDKWYEEEYLIDPTGVYRILFCDKTRSGSNSSDTGIAYLLKFDGDHCVFREVAQCRPRHGEIK